MKRSTLIIVSLLAIGGLIASILWWQGRDTSGDDQADEPLLITRQAERRTLRTEETLRGTLERSVDKTVNSPISGRASDVAIEDGDLVEPGDIVMSVDGRPSVAVNGDLEFFRPLDVGSRGPDVEQLEQILFRAGFDPGVVDNLYTEETRQALGVWQAMNGFPGSTPETGETITLSLQGSGAYSVGAQNTASITIDPLLPSGGTFSTAPGAAAPGAASLFQATSSSLFQAAPSSLFQATSSSLFQATSSSLFQAAPTVSIVSNSPQVSEGGLAEFVLTTDIAPTAALTIPLVFGGTATTGTDYTAVASVTIAAGATSVPFTVAITQDSLVENTETIEVTVSAGAGFVVGAMSALSTIIDDEPRPQIQITGTASVNEGGTAALTLTASQPSADDLTVTINVGGGATPGNNADYRPIGTVFTIPAGQTSVTIPVVTLTDDDVENEETVLVQVLERPGYTIGGSDTASLRIIDTTITRTPVITITADDDMVDEGGAANFTIEADVASANAIDINLFFAGTAIDGVDYDQPAENTITLGANATTATLNLGTIENDNIGSDRTITVTLGGSATGTEYIVGAPNSATTIIEDDDIPELNITGEVRVTEGATASLVITADQAPRLPLEVQLDTTAGSAQQDLDYAPLPFSVAFPAGATSITVPVRTLTDSTLEFDETVLVDLGQAINVGGQAVNIGGATGDYTVGNRQRAVVTIVDGAKGAGPVLTISSSAATVAEGGTVIFTIDASNPSTAPIDVNLATSGHAVLNGDYTFPAGIITIQPGQTQVQVQAQTRQDDGIEGDKDIIVTILPSTHYSIGKPSVASTLIVSEDIPELTLRGGNVTVGEGESIAFIVQADQPPSEDTSVNYSFTSSGATPGVDFGALSGTVVMPAGHSSVTIPVFTIADDIRFDPFDMIVADWPARVGDIQIEPGETLGAGQPVLTITEDGFSVSFSTDANTRSDLFVDMTVELEVAAAGDLETLGQIVEIDDTATIDGSGAELYEGRVDLTETIDAAEGANVTITVITEEADNVIVVPIGAVLQGPDGDEVRVINLDTGDLERKVVTTGLGEDSFIEVKTGISVGDLIVVEVES